MTQKTKLRAPTLSDVAARAGVSRSLVSLAIRGEGYVRAELRERIAKVAAELNYQPNLAARSLASARAGYLGIVVGRVSNPLEAEIAKWASTFSPGHGFTALVSLDAESDAKAEQAISALMAHRVSGVLLIGTPYEKPAIARVAAKVPSVYIGRLLKAVAIDSVTTDHILGAHMAVDHLVSMGRKSIVHIDAGESPGAERMRQGYYEAMQRHGLGDRIRIVSGNFTIDGGAEAGRQIFDDEADQPDAIFACNDLAAIGVINEATKRGIAIPDRLSVMGYDDVMLAGTETLSLSSIHQSARDLAEAGVAALVRRLQEPEQPVSKTLVTPALVARRTTSAAMGAVM
ncbi:MAG: LacI family transcriptional regulator [Rhizobium sp.]|nr:LacI family transcriptional regulator [Rhizobium sp.]